MQTQTNKGSKMNLAKQIALACYPGYRGRKVKVEVRETYTLADYWDGGSREYATAYELATGTKQWPTVACGIPWSNVANSTVTIPAGWAVVVHYIFCGKDCGIRIYINPSADKAGLLKEAA